LIKEKKISVPEAEKSDEKKKEKEERKKSPEKRVDIYEKASESKNKKKREKFNGKVVFGITKEVCYIINQDKKKDTCYQP